MKLKLDANGMAVLTDGKPVYVKEDGSEIAFDGAQAFGTITKLNGEARAHREAKDAAEAKLKAFEGIDDPALALDAMNKIKNIDAKKLIDAGQVDEIRNAAIKATEARFEPITKERDTLKAQLQAEVIGGSFARSKYIAEKLALPADFAEARFGRHFSIADGKLLATDANGNQIYSPSNPGNPASFDEAMEFLVSAYPQKDSILKGTGNQGMNSQGSNGGLKNGAKVMSRTEFEKLPPLDRSAKMKDGYTLTEG